MCGRRAADLKAVAEWIKGETMVVDLLNRADADQKSPPMRCGTGSWSSTRRRRSGSPARWSGDHGWGRVINRVERGIGLAAAYCAAMVGFTRALAIDLAAR